MISLKAQRSNYVITSLVSARHRNNDRPLTTASYDTAPSTLRCRRRRRRRWQQLLSLCPLDTCVFTTTTATATTTPQKLATCHHIDYNN